MSIARFSRRRFLVGTAGVTLALPFLPSVMSTGHAGTQQAPKRFIFLFTANGQRPANWYPKIATSWNVVSAAENVCEKSLAGTGTLSKTFGPEFDAVRSKMLILRGLDFVASKGGGHNAQTPLSGYRVDPAVTIDQILAQSPKVYPSAPAVRSVHMMIKQAYQSPTTVSKSDAGGVLADVPHETSVAATYSRLFGSYQDEQDPLAAQRAALKISTIDRVSADYDLLRQSPKLGSEDRQRLQAHVELLHDLESRLAATGVACTKPGAPADIDLGVDDNLLAATTMNIDLLVAALKCDRTRVATLMLCPGTDLRDFSFLGGPSGDHHGISHSACYDTAIEAEIAFINNWYAKQVAELLTKLDVVEDPQTGATYLDNSIVYWGNEDGCNGYDAHAGWAMPVMLAGSAGGYFKTGRYVDYRAATGAEGSETGTPILYDAGGQSANVPTDFRGRPYNALLLSLLEAMGLAPEDYQASGQSGIGDYGDNYMNQYSIADGQKPLPYLKA
jgi:hypothetical protein